MSNCAPCHGATANGGAVGKGSLAPSLFSATPIEIAEAVTVGPGEMPVFAFEDHERNSVIRHIRDLASLADKVRSPAAAGLRELAETLPSA